MVNETTNMKTQYHNIYDNNTITDINNGQKQHENAAAPVNIRKEFGISYRKKGLDNSMIGGIMRLSHVFQTRMVPSTEALIIQLSLG